MAIWCSEYLPPQYVGNLSLFNEIWTASTFCKEIFEKVYRHSITVIPHPVMEDAIYQLQEVYNNSDLRKARASYASKYIKEELSFHSIGKIIKDRLDSIYEECGDVIADQNVYLIQQLQFLKVENAHLRREIHRMKKNLIIRFVLFLKNKTRQIKNNLKTANS